ncbi:MAG: hypothetical protein SWK76_12850 [Actinomycetota bacterium]|nr:hypothetical protein [Actinomycetota bacterium]
MTHDGGERKPSPLERALEDIGGVDMAEQATGGGFLHEKSGEGGSRIEIPSFGQTIEITFPGGEMSVPREVE